MNIPPELIKQIIIGIALFLLGIAGYKVLTPTVTSPTPQSSTVNSPTPQSSTVTSPTPQSSTPQLKEIKILVVNPNNERKPIEDAEVTLIVSNGSPVKDKTSSNGYVTFTIPERVKVRVFIRKEGFIMNNDIIDEIIIQNEIKIYELIPEKNISLRNSFPTSPSVAVNPPPLPKPSPIAVNPPPLPTSSSTETTNQQKTSQKNYNSFEFYPLNNFKIDVFF
jgi:hypothetical protein